jgi:nucleoside-diphosphate-sugar epimerase
VRLLVLGGTLFLGRHAVEAALADGHEVTLFNRGRTAPDLFPEVERIRGDRAEDLSGLAARDWDAVLDTSGYLPRVVRASVETLERRVGRYAFVSSISVYADLSAPVEEDAPTAELRDPASEDVAADYGALKAACEREVHGAFGPRALVVRPGLIVGPHDPTGRFTYWVERAARGGDVLAPGDPRRRVQLIDARDLGAWIVRALESGVTGVFNATGPEPRPTMADVLDACRRAAGGDWDPIWVDDALLLERGVGEWDELPLWLVDPEWRGMLEADVSRAIARGLTFRALEETARDTLEWVRGGGAARRDRAPGMPPDEGTLTAERERELLTEWSARA